MDLSAQMHVAAGVGALVLGVGVLARGPARRRSRIFSLLCGSLALWNLGVAFSDEVVSLGLASALVFLAGGCAAAPLALHFAATVAAFPTRVRRGLLLVAYPLTAGLWLSAWFFYDYQPAWDYTAIAVLGAVLLAALAIFARHVLSLPAGRERQAHQIVLLAGVLAVGGGLSDFLPRDGLAIPKMGPVFVIVFLLVISSVVVRRRFLDVDVYLARVVALLAGATGAAAFLYAVARLFGPRFLPLLAASLILIALAGPLGKLLLTRAREAFGGEDPIAAALVATSRRLPLAHDAERIWEAIEEGRRGLPGNVRLVVYLKEAEEEAYRPAYLASGEANPPAIPALEALPLLLSEERAPLTRRFLRLEALEGVAGRRRAAADALETFDAVGSEMVVPLLGEERLIGWMSVGGGDPERYLRAEVAAAFLAVGNQAVASLERIEAQEEARRQETLAAVGELAAGLAHEVRNPVAAIRGAAQAITPEATPSQAEEMLEVIKEESERLGRVVGVFLDYARPQSPRREPVDLVSLAERAARTAELADLGLAVNVEGETGAPRVVGDPDQIQRAFENLVRNAREATGPGGTLRIRVSREPEGKVAARFEDDGPGIPDDQIPLLFRPFHSTRPGGTGLGLALVHRIIDAHGGEIRVEGRPGTGAVFTLVLPAVENPASC